MRFCEHIHTHFEGQLLLVADHVLMYSKLCSTHCHSHLELCVILQRILQELDTNQSVGGLGIREYHTGINLYLFCC
jgi:hypothetical protein